MSPKKDENGVNRPLLLWTCQNEGETRRLTPFSFFLGGIFLILIKENILIFHLVATNCNFAKEFLLYVFYLNDVLYDNSN